VTALTEAGYRKSLVNARRQQLQVSKETVARVDKVLRTAAKDLQKLYRSLPGPEGGESLRRSYIRDRQAELKALAKELHARYGQVLGAGMAENAQAAVEREARVAQLVLPGFTDAGLRASIRKSYQIGSATVAVDFSPVALGAIESVLKRVYGDGLKLSDRLWKLDEFNRAGIEDRLLNALATGQSARDLAGDLLGFLVDQGSDNARYRCMRLARTEINNAYREAAIQAATDPETGKLRSFIRGIRWSLSASHAERDICDLYAADDGDGLGRGVYLPDNVPFGHAHCMCFLTDELVDYPEVSAPRKAPAPEGAPDSQVERYARAGDPVAERELARRVSNQETK
jgi:hypothetical protein